MAEPRWVALDTETSGLRLYQGDKAHMASFADETGAWALPREAAGAEIRRLLAEGRHFIMHNSPFDRAAIAVTWGIEFPDDRIYDTMAVDWALDENADHRLKEGLGVRFFGVDAKAEKDELRALMKGRTVEDVYRELRETVNLQPRAERERAAVTRTQAREISAGTKRGWDDLTFEELKDYAEQDAFLTWRSKWHLDALLEADPYPVPDLDRQRRLGGLAYRITRTGIRVNGERAEAGLAAAEERIAELRQKFVLHGRSENVVNLDSTKQLRSLLFEEWGLPVTKTTPSGLPSTDKTALEELSYDHRIVDLLEYRGLQKQVSAYYLPLLDRLGPNSRINPSLNPWRTVTGRFSMSGPNLQTIPRETTSSEIRKVFEAEPGMVLGEFDLKQIEVRVAAAISKEPNLLSVYDVDGDVYQALADDIGVDRQTAKTVILSAQYGVGPKTLATTLARGTGQAPDKRRARKILDAYWRNYQQLHRLMGGLEEVAQRRGYLPLWKPGRRRLFRSPSNPYPRWYTALNAAIQGGAADFLKDVLLELEPAVADVGRIVLTVHDSVVLEHEPGAEGVIAARLAEITADCSPYAIDTPWDYKAWHHDEGLLAA